MPVKGLDAIRATVSTRKRDRFYDRARLNLRTRRDRFYATGATV